jgi:hypothetical protein
VRTTNFEKWPVTIVVGAYMGHAIGLCLGIVWRGIATKGPKSLPKLENIEEEKKVM